MSSIGALSLYPMMRRARAVFEEKPALVIPYDIKPATIAVNDKKVNINLPDTNRFDRLYLVKNKYADLNEYDDTNYLPAISGDFTIDPPEKYDIFAYTLFGINENNEYEYIGESMPLEKNGLGEVEEKLDKIDIYNEEVDYVTARNIGRGHLKMSYTPTSSNYEVDYYISLQHYQNHNSRLFGYGKAQEIAKGNQLTKQLGKKIIEDSEAVTEFEKIEELSNFVQSLMWKSDLESEGVYEYIRRPTETLVMGLGDCKDTTFLLNSLLQNTLDVDTGLVLSSGHMTTGIRKDTLRESTVEYFESVTDVTYYEGFEGDYLPIEPTNEASVGEETNTPVFALYTDHYQLMDVRGLIEHTQESTTTVLNGNPT